MGVGGQRHIETALPPEKRQLIHCTGSCVGPKSRSEGGAGGEKSRPHQYSFPKPFSP
jgi:hypothetical protein